MKLSQLFSIFKNLKLGDKPTHDVASIVSDSRKLDRDTVFVAIRGHQVDGHKFLGEAIAKGAIGLVVEDFATVPPEYAGAVVQVEDSRVALGQLANRFYGEPSKNLFVVGVTGTNGKTTTTHMIESILTEFGWKTGVIGTIDHHLGSQVWPTELTTPDPIVFQRRLSEFIALGAKAVCLEASSQALVQNRVDDVQFDCAVFSNLTRDHLDYHGDMESYFLAKQKLFSDLLANSEKPRTVAVINSDDVYGQRLRDLGLPNIITYGSHEANLSFKVLEMNFQHTTFEIHSNYGNTVFEIKLLGLHNVYNACAAIGVGLAAGATLETCARGLVKLKSVAGRLDAVPNKKGVHVFVDYAHTDDALKNSGSHLHQIRMRQNPNTRIITVFGCGGDRDKGKRPLMLQAALGFSDVVVVTSDNPRTENPNSIIDDILKGQQNLESIVVEVDRKKAIEYALNLAAAEDVVLIAGKGHEDYQIIGDTKIAFSDAEVVKEYLK